MKEVSPFGSVVKTVQNFLGGTISFPRKYIGRSIIMNEGEHYRVFRHVSVKTKDEQVEDRAVFIVKFKLKKMSVEKNRLFSLLPIPMFIGLPGFISKFWMCNESTGYNQGIYQWKTFKDAKAYSKSFAVKFMTKRSIPGSVEYQIIQNKDIMSYIKE